MINFLGVTEVMKINSPTPQKTKNKKIKVISNKDPPQESNTLRFHSIYQNSVYIQAVELMNKWIS